MPFKATPILLSIFLSNQALAQTSGTPRDPFWARGVVANVVPTLACPVGQEAVFFGLAPLAGDLPKASELRFPGGTLQTPIKSPDGKNNMRLDLCLDSTTGDASLQRIVYRDNGGGIRIAPVREDSQIAGLTDSLFAQDVSALSVILTYKWFSFGDWGMILHGTPHATLGPIVAFSFVTVPTPAGTPLFPGMNDRILVGTLEYGSPFRDGICQGVGQYEQAHHRFGDIQLNVGLCIQSDVMGVNTRYTIVDVTVIDSSITAPESIRGLPQILNGPVLQESLRGPVVNHHNDCDNFAVSLPHGIYGVTSRWGTGYCDTIVDGAPSRSPAEDQPDTVKLLVSPALGRPFEVYGDDESCRFIFNCHNTRENGSLSR